MNRFFTLALLCLSLYCAAQKKQGQARIDSLLTELPKLKEDTLKVKVLHALATGYTQLAPDKSMAYAQQVLQLSQKIRWGKGESVGYSDLGSNYRNKADFPAALSCLFKSLTIAEDIGYTTGICVASLSISGVYLDQDSYSKARPYVLKAQKVSEETGDRKQEHAALGILGVICYGTGNYPEAIAYNKKALQITEELHNTGESLKLIGNLALNYAKQKDYATALSYNYKSLRLSEETGSNRSEAINLGNIGVMYFSIVKDTGYIKPDSLIPAGKAANLAKAITYLNKAIVLCREYHLDDVALEFAEALSSAYVYAGNYKDALEAYQRYTAVKDSLFTIENTTKIEDLETKRALELKDKDIQIAKLAITKKRYERYGFIAGIVVLLGILGVVFRNFKTQQKNNVLITREKKRSDDLLLNILPAEVAEELKADGRSAAKQYEEVSVLFTDFVDFTRIADRLGPQALVSELHECFTAFDAIIERNGLEKIKTIGDAYMAVCGLPASNPLHAVRTVQAALDISAFIKQRRGAGGVFEIRIGVNTGPVVAGIVGVKKFAYDIWGDTVNTAARMEQHSEPGKVNVSQTTYELVKDDYRCDYRGQIKAKNKGAMDMYFVQEVTAGELVA